MEPIDSKEMKITVVGGGLAGSLSAVAFAKRGFQVKLFEKRPPLNQVASQQKSINLALSKRGLTALEPYVAIDDKIPMFGRCIHPSMQIQKYSPFNYSIFSVDRKKLNEILIEKLKTYKNAEIFYEHSLKDCNFDTGSAIFNHGDKFVKYESDIILGCDGAYSMLRNLMMKKIAMNYSQNYIDHLYAEIKVLPKNGEFVWDPNCLHIWPKHEFMLIALPNLDKSFTATLFMDAYRFKNLGTKKAIINFFKATFPDFIETVGENQVGIELLNNPKSRLVSVKCSPHSYKRAVIIGDASHAMVFSIHKGSILRARHELCF
eukprot:NODE_432_length_7521_cov_0.745891.p4 type:complete len:318 gc:universal NODE_432_length_7521_cov_0.745891:2240-3193(+)